MNRTHAIASEARIREQAAVLDALLANAPDYVLYLTLDGTIRFLNRTVAPLVREDLIGTHWLTRVPPEHQGPLKAAFDAVVATGEVREYESPGLGADGATAWYARRLGPVRHGREIIGVLVFTRDVTERRALEERAREVRALAERHRQLEAANAELDGFAYSVSHDLRAPLRAIGGFATLLADEHGNRLPDEGRRLLARIGDNVARMSQLIEDLLSFSRAAREVPAPQKVDMKALAGSIARELAASEPNRDIEIRIDDLPAAHCDPRLVRQVWENLVGNAVKYTRHRPRAQIHIRAKAKDGEVVYAVQDNGAGFDMAHARRLFGVFQRLHSQSEFEGTGVGLSLARRIVMRHGGRIWAEATMGAGATFFFSLPIG